MDRRSFLSALIASGALYTAGGLPGVTRAARASDFPLGAQPFLVSVLLNGGPDFRHLMPPAFDSDPSSFGNRYWHANASAHATEADDAALQARWDNDYFHIGDGATQFGILNSCTWLKQMWDMGHVAVVNNLLTTSSRNHPFGVLISEQGDRNALPNDYNVSGWGGKLGAVAGRNVMSLTQIPRHFCYSADAGGLGRSDEFLISATDTRSLSLFPGDPADWVGEQRAVMTRSMAAYYEARRSQFTDNPLTARFAQHESKLRAFGAPIDERLALFPVPTALEQMYGSSSTVMHDVRFGLQTRNLYDSFAVSDIVNMGIAALEYRGFDTHRAQKEAIEPRLRDLFGDVQAFATLYDLLPASITDRLVITFHGEFGRQIRSNGDGGTDHGEGGTMLIVGKPVNGGIYGEMFPPDELLRLDHPSPQITGLTGIEAIYATLADWFSPGSSASIFPDLAETPVESGLNLNTLLS